MLTQTIFLSTNTAINTRILELGREQEQGSHRRNASGYRENYEKPFCGVAKMISESRTSNTRFSSWLSEVTPTNSALVTGQSWQREMAVESILRSEF